MLGFEQAETSKKYPKQIPKYIRPRHLKKYNLVVSKMAPRAWQEPSQASRGSAQRLEKRAKQDQKCIRARHVNNYIFLLFKMPPRASRDPPRALKMRSRTPTDGQKKFELVEKKVEKQKSRQRSSTVVARVGRSKTKSTFKTVEPQRVAAVVARSALQSAAPSAARRVVTPP